jgi:hypothetical protein
MKRTLLIALLPWLLPCLQAQRPLPEVEAELAGFAKAMAESTVFDEQIAANRRFAALLIETLARPESYAYPFDSLRSISILRAEDNSFRLFTWQLSEKLEPEAQYGEVRHNYFGLVQRKYLDPKSRATEYIVIPLVELPRIPLGVENMLLDDQRWLGGLYYPARYRSGIPAYTLRYYDPRDRDAEGKIKRKRQTFYLLMGWNGVDQRSNLKFVDVMTFDPEDKRRVLFGADVFYFDPIPKYRAVFKYSEYAPFTLNYSYVKKGLGKRRMIVYDHLAAPRGGSGLEQVWDLGPDGSYDALFYDRGSSSFAWGRNVQIAERYNERFSRKVAEQQRRTERERLRQANIRLPGISEPEKE